MRQCCYMICLNLETNILYVVSVEDFLLAVKHRKVIKMLQTNELKLAVLGLGYVGLPLAVEFGKKREVIGFDINSIRINELKAGIDRTMEINPEELIQAQKLNFTNDIDDLAEANCFIITVPTPIDSNKQPNLKPLRSASELVGQILKVGDIVIYESTVYPGAIEEECIPILQYHSNLLFNEEFFCGYSPERINPGDKKHRLSEIVKITSGSTLETAQVVDNLYNEIINAGTYKASSIKVAEAAKVIENTQRDLNIALINEFSIIFNNLGIDTEEVLEAAATKWNFLHFKPGLVGGHCIGVDPYYLTFKAQKLGYNPELILAGRRLNDSMGRYVASQIVKRMIGECISVKGSRILAMGFTFKENCPDTRNTRVSDLVDELVDYGCEVDIYDPWIDPKTYQQYPLRNLISAPNVNAYDAIILVVAHDLFKHLSVSEIKSFGKTKSILCDLKHILPKEDSDWRL